MTEDDEGLFARWSRRKRGASEAAAAPADPASDDRTEEVSPAPEEDLTDAELLEKFGLPDPDTLGEGDDFRAFMAKHVPDHLRRRALRKLWISNPVLANVDGLVDYGGDFTDAATVPDVLVTAYRVGKGFLQKAEAETAPPEDDAARETETVPDETPPDEPPPEEIIVAEAAPDTDPVDLPDPAPKDATETDPEPPRPRRMAFRTG